MRKNLPMIIATLIAAVLVIWGIATYSGAQAGPTSTLSSPTTTTVPDASEPQSGWSSYENVTYGFRVEHPDSHSVNEGYRYRALGHGKEIPGVSFTVPASQTSGTNLSKDTYLSVETLPRGMSCAATSFLSDTVSQESVTENGRAYSVAKGGGAGAGNFYDETVYATQAADACYGLRLFIHSTNVGNYDPGTVAEFDRGALDRDFAQFRASFTSIR